MNILRIKKLCLFALSAIALASGCTAAGCRSCKKEAQETRAAEEAPPQGAKKAKIEDHKEKKVHTASIPIQPEAELASSRGNVKITRYEGHSKYPIPKGDENKIFIGDRIEAGENSTAEINFTEGGKATIEGPAEMMIGMHLPFEIVVIRGRVSLETAQLKGRTRRYKVQTPGGTLFHAGPSSSISVARNGATRIYVKDCPAPEPSGKKENSAKAAAAFGYSYIVGEEEKPVSCGDLLLINSKLGESVTSGYTDTDVKAGEWLIAANEDFSRNRDEYLDWFIQWLPQGIDKIDEILAWMDGLRLKNISLMEKLKSFREESRTSPPGKKKGKKKDNLSKKMDEVKISLAENSKQMARMREVLLSRWYQLSLRWTLMGDLMTDEILARAKKDRSVMEAFITSYTEKILQIVRRRPRRKMPSKFPIPPLQKFPHPKKLAPVGHGK